MFAEPSHHPVVSACLTWMKNESKSIARSLPAAERARFQEQLTRVGKYLEDRHPQEKSLVIFAGVGTWELVRLQLEVANELHWGRPDVSQLFWLIEEHRPVGIIVVDRTGARFLRYQLQEWVQIEEMKFDIDITQWKKEELGHVTGQNVRKTRGTQRDVFEHRMEAQYARLCGLTAKRAATLSKKHNFAGIFFVGADHLVGPIKAAIPQELREQVVLIKEDLGKLSDPEVQKTLEPMIAEWERRHQAAPVSALLESKHGTILGIDETLAQVQKGRIRTLVLERDLDLRLHQCTQCGWMDRSADPVCRMCGGARHATTLREVLPDLVKTQHLKLEIVSGDAATTLKQVGGLGGWLREAKRLAAR
jgi:hypothetical protein